MNKKQRERLAALALAVTMAASTFSPVTAFAEEPETLPVAAEETALYAPEEPAAPDPAAEPTAVPEPTAGPTAEPESTPEPAPEQTPEPSATPEPIHTLLWDNAVQIEEQRLAAQQAAEEAAAQGEEPPEAEIDPALAAVLASEAGFPAGSRADARLLKGEELDAALQSLTDALTAAAKEQDPDAPGKEAAALLPLWLGVLDTEGGEQTALGEVAVTLTVEDTEALQEKELYHQTDDAAWEKLDYTVAEEEPATPETAEDQTAVPGSVTFAAGELGVFLFVETADVLPEEPQEPAEIAYTYEDDAVLVRALVPQEAAFPANVTLHADALAPESEEYRAAYEALAADLQLEEGQQLVFAPFEVYFLDEDGAKLEPEDGTVRVEMQLKTDPFAGLEPAAPDEAVQIAHLKDDGSVEYLPNEGETPAVLAFETPSFSVLGPYLVVPLAGDGDGVESVSIDTFNVSFSSGAVKTGTGEDVQYVWNPTDPASGHDFVYRLDYTVSGTYANGQRALQITLPLHILKDRDGNWADKFDCPYLAASEVPEGEQPDFVYEIDEEHNTVTIYNYKDLPAGEAGYIEFSYTTTKSTLDYVDMGLSEGVTATLTAKGSDRVEKTAEATADPVAIDTHATINYTQKQTPTYYTAWQASWGDEPENAGDYYYLVWPVHTYINKNTSPYNFSLADTFTDYGGKVVGYRFAGQSSYSLTATIENQRSYGDRYDYVLTRYSKEEAAKVLADANRYEVHNTVTATVDPIDQVDGDTTAQSSKSWYYQVPEYVHPTGHFWAEKYGIYGRYSIVRSSQDVSDYTLEEFVENKEDSIDNLRYYTYGEGYPYPWTLGEGATDGGLEDAQNGLYGQKKVDYEFTDDTFYLQGVSKIVNDPNYNLTSSGVKLNDADYELTGIEWEPILRTATFDETNLKFVETTIKADEYKEEDAITLWVRTASDTEENKNWVKAAVYDLRDGGTYKDIDNTYIQSASGQNVAFQPGVKGVRFTCSNAYYHTRINLYPTVSLKRTDFVLGLIDQEEDKIRLTNEANFKVTQNDETLFDRTVQGTDYIQRVVRHSSIRKDITATRNDKLRKQYTVTWRVQASESYTDNGGNHYVPQQSGTFYDLAPAGAVIDLSSVKVTASGQTLPAGSYTVATAENYKDSGRTLLTVAIAEPTDTQYVFTYSTIHQWNAIQDYGKNLLNSVAYETGNDDLGDGLPNNGGSITDKNLLSGLGDGGNKYLYAEARYAINITMAANTGLLKQVKGPGDTGYTYSSTVSSGGVYSYQIRLANDGMTQSKDIIFFDSLENFYQDEGRGDGTENASIPSDWHGALIDIDLAAMREKGVTPVVYLSAVEGLNPNLHHDLNETDASGAKVWFPYAEFLQTHTLAEARAVAVDATTATGGGAYRLARGDSLAFTLYLRAPASDETDADDPTAYNNIYVSRTGIAGNEGTETETSQFFHQDYTQIHYRITGDLHLLKVSAADGQTPVPGATYLLRGTSDYGTVYETRAVTGRDGTLTFAGIEKGNYELLETACTDDWQLNTELYKVTVHGDGSVTVDRLTQKDEDGPYLVEDEPRIHADLVFDKRDSTDANKTLEGVEFRLSGTSDYGNDVLLYAESDEQGRVRFDNIELGTYTLAETKTLDGYIPPQKTWVVKVDERGVATLYEADGKTPVKTPANGYQQIENEPLHTVQFVKSSSYGVNIYLEGAKFTLSGVSDYGTDVEMEAVSDSAENFGRVTFDGLEPGTYTLQETEAPADHELNDTRYTVKVYPNGTFEILGMEKETIAGLGEVAVYNIKNDRTGGTVEVTKVWEDGKTNDDREWIPVITISTELPSKDPNGYSITFSANGGSFDGGATANRVVYANSISPAFGTSYKVPARSGYNFLGWYTAAEGGTKYEFDNDNGTLSNALTADVTLYAHWQPPARYAVQLYGIGVDTDKNGKAMGLTFGPALGANYINSYKAHTVDETTHAITGTDAGMTNLSNAYRCLHYDDWNTIIEWNNKDPNVYEKCIANQCTHSVVLDLSKFSGGSKTFTPTGTGDGPAVLYNELTPNTVRYWNRTNTNSGGWGVSNMRAMLNGIDDDNNDGITTNHNYLSPLTANWSATDCLLATFPQELQNAIGARATRYDSVYNSKTDANLKTTYDKLWLFSPNEISQTAISNTYYNHPLEALPTAQGTHYQRWNGYTLSTSSNSAYQGYYDNGNSGSTSWFWLRSSYGNRGNGVLYVYYYGNLSGNNARYSSGIAPGFSLAK